MADETYTTRDSSRGDRSTIVNYTGHVPGTGSTRNTGYNVQAGINVFPKDGQIVLYYNNSDGTNQVLASGGKGGQGEPPQRTVGQLVGTTTGKSTPSYVQVSWVNTWWQDGKFSPFNPNAFFGERKYEDKVSWVSRAVVELTTDYKTPEKKEEEEVDNKQKEELDRLSGLGKGSGIDTTTLGMAAVGFALLNRKRKGNGRR